MSDQIKQILITKLATLMHANAELAAENVVLATRYKARAEGNRRAQDAARPNAEAR